MMAVAAIRERIAAWRRHWRLRRLFTADELALLDKARRARLRAFDDNLARTGAAIDAALVRERAVNAGLAQLLAEAADELTAHADATAGRLTAQQRWMLRRLAQGMRDAAGKVLGHLPGPTQPQAPPPGDDVRPALWGKTLVDETAPLLERVADRLYGEFPQRAGELYRQAASARRAAARAQEIQELLARNAALQRELLELAPEDRKH